MLRVQIIQLYHKSRSDPHVWDSAIDQDTVEYQSPIAWCSTCNLHPESKWPEINIDLELPILSVRAAACKHYSTIIKSHLLVPWPYAQGLSSGSLLDVNDQGFMWNRGGRGGKGERLTPVSLGSVSVNEVFVSLPMISWECITASSCYFQRSISNTIKQPYSFGSRFAPLQIIVNLVGYRLKKGKQFCLHSFQVPVNNSYNPDYILFCKVTFLKFMTCLHPSPSSCFLSTFLSDLYDPLSETITIRSATSMDLTGRTHQEPVNVWLDLFWYMAQV